MYNQTGTNITSTISTSGQNGVPSEDPTGGWEDEEALDVEWAHAIAPGANIDLIECNIGGLTAASLASKMAGVVTASTRLPGVSVVSMSWGFYEDTGPPGSGQTFQLTSATEAMYDGDFTTPGVTYLAASGDNGLPGVYPAYSPNVIAV